MALLVEGISGASPAEVAELPDDFLPLLGLSATLGMTAPAGFRGIVSRIKREVAGGVKRSRLRQPDQAEGRFLKNQLFWISSALQKELGTLVVLRSHDDPAS